MLRVEVQKDQYVLSMPYYDPALVTFCKNLQQARYHPTAKAWTAARNVPNALDLHGQGYLTDRETLDLAVKPPPADLPFVPPVLQVGVQPFDHQFAWLKWSSQIPRAMCIGEMGVGKTLMAMLWWDAHRIDPKNIVIVCPATLIHNWVKELDKFIGVKAIAIVGTSKAKHRLAAEPGLHVVNYESFIRMMPQFQDKTTIVCDESHKVKTPNTQRSKALHAYCNDMQRTHVLALTGTPVSQGAQDYYSQFKMIEPRLLGSSYTAFKRRYCVLEQVRGAPMGVTKITGYRQLEELTRIIAPYCQTYLKKDCLDLPPKTYQVRYVQLGGKQAEAYRQLKVDFVTWLESGEQIMATNILTRLIRFSQITQGYLPKPEGEKYQFYDTNPKLEALSDIIEELPPADSFVVMCRFSPDINLVRQMLYKNGVTVGIIDGSTAMNERQNIVDAFQAGRIRCLLGQVSCAGVGITLTKAQTMVFYSNTYSYTDRLQAEDRIHRIGTTGTCNYIDIVAQGTVDEHVLNAIRHKQDLADTLTNLRKDFCD